LGGGTVETGKTLETEIDVVEGLKFDQGYLSPSFATDRKTQTVDMKDAQVLLVDHKITSARALLPILEQVSRENRSLFIISADGVESEVLTMLVLNKLNGLKVCAVKAPGFGDNRTSMLQDMAVLTGAEIVSQDLGHKLEEVKLKHLGKAAQITATQDHTIILGGGGSKDDIAERCSLLRDKLKQPELSTYEKEKVQERLAKLLGGVAVIKVGGASEFEVGEKKDRVDDALNATMAAIDEGIVAGGGAALLYASLALKSLKGDNFDQDIGIEIVRKAIQRPIKQIAENAGVEGAVVVSRLLNPPNGKVDTDMGYNAQTGVYENMIEAGIIDPTKVVRTALVDAASVAGLMVTTEVLVSEEPEKTGPAGGAGGMGGMGGGGMGGMGDMF
jgi:chaperonin GroEL